MLGYFNNRNIIHFSHKATSSEDIDKIYQVALDGISDNMNALVQTGKHCFINTTDMITMGYYSIEILSEAYTLQEDTTCDGQISTDV